MKDIWAKVCNGTLRDIQEPERGQAQISGDSHYRLAHIDTSNSMYNPCLAYCAYR